MVSKVDHPPDDFFLLTLIPFGVNVWLVTTGLSVSPRLAICRFVVLAIVSAGSTLCAASPPCAPRASTHQGVKTDRELLQLLRGAKDGDRDAQFRTAIGYETGCGFRQDFAQAAIWYRKAAESGHPSAQNNLGRLYLHGLGVEQSDAEAMKWFLRAASEGFAPAQNNVGYMYEMGRTNSDTSAPSPSSNEAVKWYRKAAESGSADGELNLGLIYLNGNGVRQDFAEALNWFHKAAAHGSAAACDQLGRAYQNGVGVPFDYGIAENWYRLAIHRGYPLATHDLATLDEVRRQAASNLDVSHSNR